MNATDTRLVAICRAIDGLRHASAELFDLDDGNILLRQMIAERCQALTAERDRLVQEARTVAP